jgi:hypothetical protein
MSVKACRQELPNTITALDAAQASCLHFRRRWRGVTEFLRYALLRAFSQPN